MRRRDLRGERQWEQGETTDQLEMVGGGSGQQCGGGGNVDGDGDARHDCGMLDGAGDR